MKIDEFCSALSSSTRVRIIKIIQKRELTAAECYKMFAEKYSNSLRRESIYKEMEKLLENGLLHKRYDNKTKKLVYALKIKKITIDLLSPDLTIDIS